MLLPDRQEAQALAQRLAAVNYTVDGVQDLLGPVAAAALERDAITPAQGVLTGDDSPLSVVVRVFLLGETVSPSLVEDAVCNVESLRDLVSVDDGLLAAAVEVAPYAVDDKDWVVAADWPSGRRREPLAADHVLGVGGASTMLAQCTVRPEVDRALDIGTGCGVQALHLARHSAAVVATDVSQRCLSVAAFNASLNGIDVEFRSGSLFEPVLGERFDLIVSNPPFVIASPKAIHHDYRDSGFPGDEVCAQLVSGAAERLRDGGWCQVLANWAIVDDDWARHPRSWLQDSPLDAWVIQRDVQDPAAYVETWLSDSGDHLKLDYHLRYDEWLTALERAGIVGVGFGLITVRAGRQESPIRRFEHAPQSVRQPLGPSIANWFAGQDTVRSHPDAQLLMLPLVCASDVAVQQTFRANLPAESAVVARRTSGFCWEAPIDEFGVELLGRANGRQPIGEVIAALGVEYGLEPAAALEGAIPVVRQLVVEGFLHTDIHTAPSKAERG